MIYYPRKTKLNGKEVLVRDDEVVAFREHLTHDKRILFFTGKIEGATDVHDLLLGMDTLSQEPIKIIITSGGGDLDVTFMIYDTIKLIQSPIITIGRYCASAAAMLLAAGSKRYLFPHARVMIHLPSMGMEQEADARTWDIRHELMQGYKNRGVDILKECGVKKTREEILADMDREFWLEPQEAIDYGLADEILTPEIWADLKGGR